MKIFSSTKSLVIFAITAIVATLGACYIFVFGVPGVDTTETVTPIIELTTDKVMLSVGDEFNASDYIEVATDEYGIDISDKISNADISTKVEGSYNVTYSYECETYGETTSTLRVNVVNNNK